MADALAVRLRQALGPGVVFSGTENVIVYEYDYGLDRGMPDVVALPRTTAEVQIPWLVLLRIRNSGRVTISGAEFSTPLTFTFPGREVLTVQFLGPGGETVLSCYVNELYDGQRMRPEKLATWRALRERYGNRDESTVRQGALLARAA